jgi:hypothetical protein
MDPSELDAIFLVSITADVLFRVLALNLRRWPYCTLLAVPRGGRLYAAFVNAAVLNLDCAESLTAACFRREPALDSSADLDTHELP